jgi:tRNA(Ile)-lysidine synthase
VSDFLADRKVPPAVRRHQTVLCSADGSIVWVVGLRPDDRAAIRRGHTRRALVVEKW